MVGRSSGGGRARRARGRLRPRRAVRTQPRDSVRWSAARPRPPPTLPRSTRWTGSSSPRASRTRSSRGARSRARTRSCSGADSRSRCSSTRATEPASTTPASTRFTPAARPTSTPRSGKARAPTCSSRAPSRSSLRRTESGTWSRRSDRSSGRAVFRASRQCPRGWRRTWRLRSLRAYRKTRRHINEAPAAEVAAAEKSYFPAIDAEVLARCIETYQGLGCWTPHIEITRDAYEATLDIFAFNGLVTKRHPFESVCTPPPAG